MKILTLDLSTHSTGYCVGEYEQMQKHGCIVASNKDTIHRIIVMREEIKILLDIYKPDKIVMQEVQPDYSSRTTKVLMWLQAAIVIAAYEFNSKIQVQFIRASQWRAKLKMKQGRGIKRDQLKPRDIEYIQNKYNIKVNDDEADAICIFDAYWIKQVNEINWE